MDDFKQICTSIFQQLCPGYSDQPHIAMIKHICQTALGSDGQMDTLTTIEYYQQMLNAARPFMTQSMFAVGVRNKFIQGLDPCIIGPVCCLFPQHSMVHNLYGSYQRSQIVIILTATQSAKDKIK
jgi:hypothetical protein